MFVLALHWPLPPERCGTLDCDVTARPAPVLPSRGRAGRDNGGEGREGGREGAGSALSARTADGLGAWVSVDRHRPVPPQVQDVLKGIMKEAKQTNLEKTLLAWCRQMTQVRQLPPLATPSAPTTCPYASPPVRPSHSPSHSHPVRCQWRWRWRWRQSHAPAGPIVSVSVLS